MENVDSSQLDLKEPVEVVLATDQDVSQTPHWGDVSGTSIREKLAADLEQAGDIMSLGWSLMALEGLAIPAEVQLEYMNFPMCLTNQCESHDLSRT